MSVERLRDNLNVADLGFELVDLNIQTRGVVSSICGGLPTWSEELRKKAILDEAEAEIIANNIGKLSRLSSLLQTSNRDIEPDLQLITETQRQLGFVGASFS